MLRATYKRQTRFTGQAPEMIGAEYGEIDNRLMLGALASGIRDVAQIRGDEQMATLVGEAMHRAGKDGKVILLP